MAQIQMLDGAGIIADIGSDHGLFCIAALLQGRAKFAIATDISDFSLNKARRNIKKYSIEDKIELRVGDGLNVIKKDEVNIVSISGIGGENIVKILEEGKGKLPDMLLLTPSSGEIELRRCLSQLEYTAKDETVVFENNRFYQIMLMQRGAADILTENEAEFGKINLQKMPADLKRLILKKLKDANKMLNTAASGEDERAKTAKETATIRIEKYKRLLDEKF